MLNLSSVNEDQDIATREYTDADKFGVVEFFGHSLTSAGGGPGYAKSTSARVGAMLGAEVWDRTMPSGIIQAHSEGAYSGDGWYGDGGWAHVYRNSNPRYWTDGMGVTSLTNFSPKKDLVVFNIGVNDIGVGGGVSATPTTMIPVRNAMIASLSRVRASAVYEHDHSSVAYSGGRTTVTPTLPTIRSSGNSYSKITGSSRTVTITVPSDFPGGTIALGFLMDDAGVAGGNWSVTVDGGPATNFNRDGEHNMSWWTPFVYRITGLSAGSHTIVATKGTTDGYFDCWWMEASKPPLTLVVNQGYTSSYNATIRGYLNDKLLDSVAAFFDGYTRLVDVSSLITSDHVSDGTHLNDSGHALMAQTIVRAAIDAKRSLEYSSANAILGSGLSRQPHAVDGLGANFIQPNKPNVNGLVIRQSNKPGYVYGDSSSTYKYQAVDLLQIQDKDGNAIGGFDRNAQLYTKVAPGIGVFPYTQWKNTSDTQPSFAIDGNGGLWWGPGGSTAIDTYIGRSAADTLSLASGDSLVIPNGSVTVGDSTSNTFSKVDAGTYRATIPNGIGTFSFYQKKDLADANPVFGIGSDGRIYLGAGGASAVDVSIGRSSADTLGLTSGDSLDVPSGKITAAGNFGSLASVISGTNANSAGIGVSGSGGTGLYGTGTTAALLAVSTSNGIAVNAQASGTGAAIEALNSGSAPAIKINTSHGSGAALDINSQGNIVNVPTIDFDDTVADKLLLYSNTYGIGIEGSTITQWSQTNHRWRVGGTSASSGTEHMLLTSSSLDVKSKPVVNVTNPTNAQDAATKSYVDTEVADLGAAWNCVYDFGMAFLALDAGAAEWGFFQHTSGMLIVGLNTYQQPVKQFWIDSADYGSVPGKNLRFRIRGWANVNGTDPNLTVDFKMKPITFTGAADTLTTTLGTQVGNTASVTNANLGTNESEKANSTSFAIPTNGLYTVTATFSGTLANNAAINVGCRVECRYE